MAPPTDNSQAAKGKGKDPEEIKREILAESGSEITHSTSAEDLLEAASAMRSEEGEVRDKDEQWAEMADDDPSRDIPSAEVAMTFDGTSNHGSTDLSPFIIERFREIAARMKDAKRSEGEDGSTPA